MKHYIDLIEKLSDLDKKRIENYINVYGVPRENFIGLTEWLQNWSHSNQRLYKLLGNEFIKKIDYSFEKGPEHIKQEMRGLLQSSFKHSYHCFYWEFLKKLNLPGETMKGFSKVTDLENFVNDEVKFPIKYKKEGCKTTLQIQPGMKPVRALQKIVNYFKNDYAFVDFETFRLKHSMILNDKIVRGKLCVSIHPLDYLTMSDNNSNWSSCMSWKEDGCYHVGTIEMMNSNNVLCCYLEGQTPYAFGQGEENSWNNKKWRQLVYFTKDIIMSGKPYPYVNIDLSKELITIVKKLAEDNLHWTYTYGPELYKDMIHINNIYTMNQNHNWITYGGAKKHNILWDTKGMYNDMLNDSNTEYWCYRNKVKSNKIFSVSGKAPCLCCGKSILQRGDYDDYYNERYSNTGSAICDDCSNLFWCDDCQERDPRQAHFTIQDFNGYPTHICKKCFEKKVKICPDCGRPFYIKESYRGPKRFGLVLQNPGLPVSTITWYEAEEDLLISNTHTRAFPLYACGECVKNHENDIEEAPAEFVYSRETRILQPKKDFLYGKYLYKHLKSVELPSSADDIITVVT